MVGEFLRGRGETRNEISRVGREEKEKCRNASKTSPLQLPSSILSLRSHPRFPFFNVISQASDPAGFRFPFLFRAHSPRCFPVTCRHSADPSKIYPSTNVPFRFSICPVQRILPPGNTDDENRASPRRNSLSLSIYLSSLFLSLWREKRSFHDRIPVELFLKVLTVILFTCHEAILVDVVSILIWQRTMTLRPAKEIETRKLISTFRIFAKCASQKEGIDNLRFDREKIS